MFTGKNFEVVSHTNEKKEHIISRTRGASIAAADAILRARSFITNLGHPVWLFRTPGFDWHETLFLH